jgi:hypothetical protein
MCLVPIWDARLSSRLLSAVISGSVMHDASEAIWGLMIFMFSQYMSFIILPLTMTLFFKCNCTVLCPRVAMILDLSS